MEIVFRGWRREVTPHTHSVTPVSLIGNTYSPGKDEEPLTWTDGLKAFGKVENVGLGGSFLVEFNFDQQELQNWLQVFVKENPEDAIRLLAQMQAEAILALSKKMAESKASVSTA